MKPAELRFIEPADEVAYKALDHRVKALVLDAQVWAGMNGQRFLTITEVGNGEHKTSEHLEKCAVDVRIWGIGPEKWEDFARFENGRYACNRGTTGKVALVGNEDPKRQHNDHMHLRCSAPYEGPEGKIRF